jgi:anti-repressor protein
MSESLHNFKFNDQPVRTVDRAGEVWFVASDVANVLGYSNVRDAVAKHCKCVAKCDAPHPQSRDKTIAVSIIPERDVYRLIMRSKLPAAAAFEEWVVGEVLPTVRKHGAYMTPETIEKTLADPDFIIGLAQQLKSEKERRLIAEGRVDVLTQECEAMQPHAEIGRQFVAANNGATSSQVAALFGKSAVWLNDYLHKQKMLKKVNGQWLLAGKWRDQPYFTTRHNFRKNSHGDLIDHPDSLWTPKGQLAVVALLETAGMKRTATTRTALLSLEG